MKSSTAIWFLASTVIATAAASSDYSYAQQQSEPDAAGRQEEASRAEHFTLKVLPVLKDKCFGCHGADRDDIQGEFDVTSLAGIKQGGESGDPSIVSGEPDASIIMEAVRWEGLEMPPKENDRLSEEQIEAFSKWIEEGASWPDEATQNAIIERASMAKETDEGLIVDTSGGTSKEWTLRRYKAEDLWSWKPVPSTSSLLSAKQNNKNPIDYFIDRRLHENSAEAAREATPQELVRRVYFDCWGLPPSPEEVADFVAAYSSDAETAWNNLIDKLLASTSYGERAAQHWLDVTRYADTGGMSNDYERSNMWRYRDYVIRSFNADKPYDQFVTEQLAGDELADASVAERLGADQVVKTQLHGDYTAEEAEKIVATGFLRLGPWDNAMVETDEARQIYLDDLVNIVGQTFLSTTMRCVKCHDHKFDPIPTRDYYRMYAAFSTTHMAERNVPMLASENRDGFEDGEAHVRRMLDFAVAEKDRLVNKRETAARKWFDEHGLEYKDANARKDLPDDQKPPRHVGLDYVDEGQLKVREQDEWIWNRRLERYQPMAQSVYNAGSAKLAWNGARKLRIDSKASRSAKPKNHVLVGGALTALGDAVGPGVLSAAGIAASKRNSDPFVLQDDVSGRRLALAKWITHPENPLTARSIVNRIWQSHFGVGIAANPNNFGAKGAKPTHPELLDFLAADLVENGWKIKRMHRLILQSDTYRRSVSHPQKDKLLQSDPNNELLAYYPGRRLTAEEVRDAMLSMTGELNGTPGGLPAMPEINMEVALQPRMIQFSLAPAYQPDPTPQQRNRRSIYAYRVRGQADPFLELFNKPNPNESCELRDSAAVTPQAFTLMNSDVMADRSIALALRLQDQRSSVSEQIKLAIELVLNRAPADMELQRLTEYVSDMTAYHKEQNVAPRVYPTKITRSLVEEFSGKPFEYEEILPRFENYQTDPSAADVGPDVRALADACLVLLNTNEFIFVR